MELQELQTRIARRVREIPCLAGLPIFELQKGHKINLMTTISGF